MNLVQRVQDILLKPKETWPVIAAEPGDAKSLFMGYVAVLASIPPLASFVTLYNSVKVRPSSGGV